MWEKIKLINSSIWHFMLPFIKQMLTAAGPILANAALIAVKAAVGKGTNDEKYDIAFNSIKSQLADKGLVVGEAMINAALELAVLKMKSDTP